MGQSDKPGRFADLSPNEAQKVVANGVASGVLRAMILMSLLWALLAVVIAVLKM